MRSGRRLPLLQLPSAGWRATLFARHSVRAQSRIAAAAEATVATAGDTNGDNNNSNRTQSPSAQDSQQTIFEQLFPDKASSLKARSAGLQALFRKPSTAGNGARSTPRQPGRTPDRLRPGTLGNGDNRSRSSDNSRNGASPDSARHGAAQDEDKSTVLLLSNASPSLVESDFYRHAPQGRHIDGWAGGLTNVVQGRDPETQEPRGQYYLFFDSRAAALAYLDEVQRLHNLARERIGLRLGAASAGPVYPAPSAAAWTDDAADTSRLASYTLLPASIPLSLWPVRMASGDAVPGKESLRQAIVSKQRTAQGIDAREPKKRKQPRNGAEARPVLDSHKVLLKLHGGRATLHAIQHAVDDDGEHRNLPWQLWRSAEKSIFPLDSKALPSSSSHDLDAEEPQLAEDGSTEPILTHSRFVVCFADTAEARRFVRHWHRRLLVMDASKEDDAEIDASILS